MLFIALILPWSAAERFLALEPPSKAALWPTNSSALVQTEASIFPGTVVLSLLVLRYSWQAITLGLQGRHAVMAITQRIEEQAHFPDVAAAAVEGFGKLATKLGEHAAVTSGEMLESEFLQMEEMKEALRTVRRICGAQKGLLHFSFSSKRWQTVSESILTRVDELLDITEYLMDAVFCDKLEELLQTLLHDMQSLIFEFEESTGIPWWPQRRVFNGLLGSAGHPNTRRKLKLQYGLSDEELRKSINKAIVMMARPGVAGDVWRSQDTVFPDRILTCPDVNATTKQQYGSLQTQLRFVFDSMTNISDHCASKAQLLRQSSLVCYRCKDCCRMPTSVPGLLRWLDKLSGSWLWMFYKDVNAIAKPSELGNLLWIAERLATRRGEGQLLLCEAARDLMSGIEVPQIEEEVSQELTQEPPPDTTQVVQIKLPEVGQ